MPNIGTTTGTPVTGIPAGGQAGQAIVKRTAADLDIAWAWPGASAGSAGPLPGYWYDGRGSGGAAAGTNTLAATPGRWYFSPIYLPAAATMTAICAWQAASGSTTCTFAVLTCSASTGRPGAILAQGLTVASTVAGYPTVSGLSIAAPQGWVYLAMSSSGPVTFRIHDDGGLRLPYSTYGTVLAPTPPLPSLTATTLTADPAVTLQTAQPFMLACKF